MHKCAHIMFEREGSIGGGGGDVPKMEQREGKKEADEEGMRRRWDDARVQKSM
jgi:hypothetical protein